LNGIDRIAQVIDDHESKTFYGSFKSQRSGLPIDVLQMLSICRSPPERNRALLAIFIEAFDVLNQQLWLICLPFQDLSSSFVHNLNKLMGLSGCYLRLHHAVSPYQFRFFPNSPTYLFGLIDHLANSRVALITYHFKGAWRKVKLPHLNGLSYKCRMGVHNNNPQGEKHNSEIENKSTLRRSMGILLICSLPRFI
jgi:hypothetical protein